MGSLSRVDKYFHQQTKYDLEKRFLKKFMESLDQNKQIRIRWIIDRLTVEDLSEFKNDYIKLLDEYRNHSVVIETVNHFIGKLKCDEICEFKDTYSKILHVEESWVHDSVRYYIDLLNYEEI